MKYKFSKLFLVVFLLLLSGCASVQTGSLFQKEKFINENLANIYIYRPDVFPASIISPILYVDGEQTLRLPESSYVALSLPLGEHTLETRDEGSLITASIVSGFKFNLDSNGNHYIRWEPYVSDSSSYYNPVTFVSVIVKFAADVKVVPESQAIPEIQQYRKVIK